MPRLGRRDVARVEQVKLGPELNWQATNGLFHTAALLCLIGVVLCELWEPS
jgi:hypothetical protein